MFARFVEVHPGESETPKTPDLARLKNGQQWPEVSEGLKGELLVTE